MNVLGIRFCAVHEQAEALVGFLSQLGMPARDLGQLAEGGFAGGVFPAGKDSWVEVWQSSEQMPSGVMLQVVVDDADAFAEHARGNGLNPQGPMDMYGERIYFLEAPTGLQMSFQSRLA